MKAMTSKIRLPAAWQDYKIAAFLGQGSYGRVYKLEKPDGSVCAMKVVSAEAYQREADILASLADKPGIVGILDYRLEKDRSEGEKRLYILMEYLTDLPSWLQNHVLTESQIISMMTDILDGLAACRKKGLLHRDVKPENILVTEDGHAKLADFGIARIMDQDKRNMTRKGTARYMAPEVYKGRSYDHRADLYSLALVFYQLANGGRPPFLDPDLQIPDSGARQEALQKRMSGKALPAPAKASEGLWHILRKACAYRPHDRYRSPEEMKRELVKLQRRADLRKKKAVLPGSFLWTRKRKITAAVLIIFLLTASCLGYWYAQPVLSGSDGFTGASYKLYRDGTLIVSGEGAFDISCLNERKETIRKIVVRGGISYVGSREGNWSEEKNSFKSTTREIVLEEGVRCLGPYVFQNYYALEKVSLPSTLEKVGVSAFENCHSIKKISLPDGIRDLPDNLFSHCYRLRQIRFPDHVDSIGKCAFLETAWAKDRRKEPGYVMVNDILVAYHGEEERLQVPNDLGIRIIGPGVFSECSRLQYLELPDTIKRIESSAFSKCEQLREIDLPDGLKELAAYTFSGCSKLKKVHLPTGLQRIGDYAFSGCSDLEDLRLPDSLDWIGANAFYGTPFLEAHMKEGFAVVSGILLSYQGTETRIQIPKNRGIKGIAPEAFGGQIHMRSLIIPEGITWIGAGAFVDCLNLEEIRFPRSLSRIEGGTASFLYTKWLQEKEKTDAPIIVNDMLLGNIPYDDKEDAFIISDNLPITKIMNIDHTKMNIEYIEAKKLVIADQVREIDKNAISGMQNLDVKWIMDVRLPASFSETQIKEIFEKTPWYWMPNRGRFSISLFLKYS